MRTISKLFGKSPFTPLQAHMRNVAECINKTKELFALMEKGDYDGVFELAKVISKLEHNADLTKNDIDERKLPKNTTGVVITKILEGTPLMFISVNDVIVELQKKKITSTRQFSNLLKDTINKGAETLYLAIYNASNQRSYITVKLK